MPSLSPHVTCHNFYLCQLMPHSFNALFQFPTAKTVNKMCVSHGGSPFSVPSPCLSALPLIVDLLVCPRIDVIPRRLPQRFSFSFCWLCPSPSLSLLLFLSILPLLNHIPCQAGRIRGGSAAGFAYLLPSLPAKTLAGRGICLTSFFERFATVFLFFLFIINYISSKWTAVPFSLFLSLCLCQLPI